MLKKEEKNSIIEICPIRNVIARFGNKWAFLVMLVLSERECVRFNESVPSDSRCILTGAVGYAQNFEADALVSRKVYPTVPPKVEYRLTEIGLLARAVHYPD